MPAARRRTTSSRAAAAAKPASSRSRNSQPVETPCPEFIANREFIAKFVALDDSQLDISAIWAMGTWTFSPMSPAQPYTYPYLYGNGPSGSAKTLWGRDVMGKICRQPRAIALSTGVALFKTLIQIEDGEVINLYPTLSVDEIDAAYNGAKDEDLRTVFNIGYKQGTDIPRSAGKVSINYPAYCPKILTGINNGHLPQTVTNRCISIQTHIATPDEAARLTDFFPWEVDEPAAELQEANAAWAREHAMILRDYNPDKGEFINRQWEISRSLIQLARAAGIENRIRAALKDLFTRTATVEPVKVQMYRCILNLFDTAGGEKHDRLTSRQIKEALDQAGIPAGSMTALSYVFKEDGLRTDGSGVVAIDDPSHPEYCAPDKDGKRKRSHRGYHRNQFDMPFATYLKAEDEED
jgi:hypothetical protein